LPAATVDQYTERDAFGAPEIGQLVERGAHGAARIQHVVHDHRVLVRKVTRDVRLPDHGLGPDGLEIVAVQGDVERAARDLGGGPCFLFDVFGDAFSQLHAAALDANQHQVVRAVRQLDDFHGHTLQRPRHRAGVKESRACFCFWGPGHLEAETYTCSYTGVKGGLPFRTACTFATAMAAILRRVSSVALPMCGNNTVRGAASKRGWIVGSSV